MEGYELAFPVATPSSSSSGAPDDEAPHDCMWVDGGFDTCLVCGDIRVRPGFHFPRSAAAPDAGTTDADPLLRELMIAGLAWLDDIGPFVKVNGQYCQPAGAEFTSPTERLIRVLLAIRDDGRRAASRLLAERQGAEAPPKLREIL